MDAPVLRSRGRPARPAFQRYAEGARRAGRRPARPARRGPGSGRPEKSRAAARRPRQAAAPRPGRRAARPRLAVPRALAAGRRTACTTTRRPRAGHHHRHRPGRPAASASIVANDATVKGGTYYPMTVKKHLRAQEVALQNRLPCVYLVDSGGAFLPRQDEVFPDREHFGRIFYNQATMSARGHPADRRRAGLVHRRRRLRAGDERRGGDRPQPGHDLPRRPAAGEGRDRRGRHRRGARRRRRARPRSPASPTTSPTTTRTRCRSSATIVATLGPRGAAPVGRRRRPRSRRSTRRELYGVVPTDSRTPYDVREVIARLVDGSRFARVQGASTAPTLVTGFARIHGHPVGIVANNGVLFGESALKGAHFIELCDQRDDPAAVPAEHHRVHGRPRLRGGRHRQARRQDGHRRRLRPGAEAHRGHRRLVRRRQLLDVRPGVLAPVPVDVAQRPHLGDGRRAGRRRCWPPSAATSSRPAARSGRPRRRRRSRRRSASSTSDQGNPYYSTARLWDDGVIDPADTRTVLGLALSAAANAPLEPVGYGVFRM